MSHSDLPAWDSRSITFPIPQDVEILGVLVTPQFAGRVAQRILWAHTDAWWDRKIAEIRELAGSE